MGKEESLGPVQLKDDENGNENLGSKGNMEVSCISNSIITTPTKKQVTKATWP